MKILILFLFTVSLSLTDSSSSVFDNRDYISEEWIAEMLELQFLKDFDSAEFSYSMENYMKLHFDKVDHISGHYAKESKMYYYAVFGKQADAKKFELLEVQQKDFELVSLTNSSTTLAKSGLCRRGNGFPNWPVCAGTDCKMWTNGCLGIVCNFQSNCN